jgi:hypothetical protein
MVIGHDANHFVYSDQPGILVLLGIGMSLLGLDTGSTTGLLVFAGLLGQIVIDALCSTRRGALFAVCRWSEVLDHDPRRDVKGLSYLHIKSF